MEASEFSGGDVQPDGQGEAEDTGGGGFYQSYLNEQVPEDYRPHVEPYLRDIESNANQKFQEHAEYRKQWEPYEELGLSDYDPEGLGQLLQFAETMSDQEQFKNWWTEVGQQSGWVNELTQDNDVDSQFEGDYDEDESISLDDIRGAVSELMDERLAPLQERDQQRQHQEQVQQADQSITQELEQLHNQYGDFDDQTVLRFAYLYADNSDTPLADGFKDYQQLVGQAQTDTVNNKLGAPSSPEPGQGPAATSQSAPTTFAEAKAMAKERLAQSR